MVLNVSFYWIKNVNLENRYKYEKYCNVNPFKNNKIFKLISFLNDFMYIPQNNQQYFFLRVIHLMYEHYII